MELFLNSDNNNNDAVYIYLLAMLAPVVYYEYIAFV